MYKTTAILLIMSLTFACSSKSHNSPNPQAYDSSSTSAIITDKLQPAYICDQTTEYELNISGEDTDTLGDKLILTNFTRLNEEQNKDTLLVTNSPALMDKIRMDFGHFKEQALAPIEADQIRLSVTPSSLNLTVNQPKNQQWKYSIECDDIGTEEMELCNSIKLNWENNTVTFTDTELEATITAQNATAPLTLNGSLEWYVSDAVNSGRPSCLTPATQMDMIGFWDATQNYEGKILGIDYYAFSNKDLIIYEYAGDTATSNQGSIENCYNTVSYPIIGIDEGTFNILDIKNITSYKILYRVAGKDRIFTYPNMQPSTLTPSDKNPEDFTLCEF